MAEYAATQGKSDLIPTKSGTPTASAAEKLSGAGEPKSRICTVRIRDNYCGGFVTWKSRLRGGKKFPNQDNFSPLTFLLANERAGAVREYYNIVSLKTSTQKNFLFFEDKFLPPFEYFEQGLSYFLHTDPKLFDQ